MATSMKFAPEQKRTTSFKYRLLVYLAAVIPAAMIVYAVFWVVVRLINAIYGVHEPTHNVTKIF